MTDWVRGVGAVLSHLTRDKNGLNADGQVSAAERGSELLSPGLAPQLHRPRCICSSKEGTMEHPGQEQTAAERSCR